MTSPRALSLLAALSAPVFLAAAIAGWLSEAWPATPVTFGVAAFVVCGGPLLAMWHVSTASDDAEYEEEPTLVLPAPAAPPAPAPVPLPLTPKAAAARAFMGWRDSGT
ncbi:hypothetical protein DVA67_029460 [Solirubrobacter sp. CPCC 204708]|uniref:Uncharacterized protein n=1 Tax=Solirubrobacter deserti TaxID=2282478 RepID=A0ABT4RMZ4_9ACTN|nr:hypothetical protein [Solirubrobacter deserti]MBE2320130.1 hypothetical protein [Solirubrobacter deserti]MDA0139850.1 hypothetical protein [Solirubrobacter deserti]